MKRAKVLGRLWATKKHPLLDGYKIVLVSPYQKDKLSTEIIAVIDILDVKIGQDVLLSFGSGGRNVLNNQDLPIDVVISAVLDESALT